MRLHHRVKVKRGERLDRHLYFWSCPGCSIASAGSRNRTEAEHDGRNHAFDCDKLRERNRQTAWGCRNCGGTGIVSGLDCVACLGRGWLA